MRIAGTIGPHLAIDRSAVIEHHIIVMATTLGFFGLLAAAIILVEDAFKLVQATMFVGNQPGTRVVGGRIIVTALIVAAASSNGGCHRGGQDPKSSTHRDVSC